MQEAADKVLSGSSNGQQLLQSGAASLACTTSHLSTSPQSKRKTLSISPTSTNPVLSNIREEDSPCPKKNISDRTKNSSTTGEKNVANVLSTTTIVVTTPKSENEEEPTLRSCLKNRNEDQRKSYASGTSGAEEEVNWEPSDDDIAMIDASEADEAPVSRPKENIPMTELSEADNKETAIEKKAETSSDVAESDPKNNHSGAKQSSSVKIVLDLDDKSRFTEEITV